MNRIKEGYLKGYYFVDDPFLSGILKPNQDKVTIENINPGDICFDIGANCGYYSLLMARRSGGKVYSFEPLPGTFKILKKVIYKNRFTNIHSYQYAFSDNVKDSFIRGGRDGDLDACLEDDGIYVNQNNILNTKTIPVVVITIDYFVKKMLIKKVDFIKMDTQGADILVLKGGIETINRFHPKIVCEAISATRRDAIIAFMTSLGYNCEVVEVTYGATEEGTSYHLFCAKK